VGYTGLVRDDCFGRLMSDRGKEQVVARLRKNGSNFLILGILIPETLSGLLFF
jgi:hypothetical protein